LSQHKTSPAKRKISVKKGPTVPSFRGTVGSEFGPLIATYRARRGIFFSLLLPGFLGVLAPLAYGTFLLNYAYAKHGPIAAASWSRSWFQLAGLALIIFGILIIYRLLQTRRFVSVYKMGVRLRLNPLHTRQLRWDQIAGISNTILQDHFFGIRLRTRQHAILFPNKGNPLTLGEELEKLPELISRLKASLYPRLLSGLMTDFATGKWLYFGPIAINKQGMRIRKNRSRNWQPQSDRPADKKGTFLTWDRIEHLTVHSGELVVELRDQSPNCIPVSRIPNLELLLQIIQQRVKA